MPFRADRRSCCLVWLFALALSVIPSHGLAGQQPVKSDFPVPLELAPRDRAILLPFGDPSALVYELVAANPSPRTLVVDRLHALSGDRVLETWEGADLVRVAARLPGTDAEAGDALVLEPGDRAVLYLWLDPLDPATAPTALGHRAVVRTADSGPALRWSLSTDPVPVERVTRVIDAPVQGGRWLVGNGFANDADHRRVITASGRLFIPQRFGADFLKLDVDGDNATAERPIRNAIFHAFDEPVYAVADGEVVTVRRGLADLEAPSAPGALSWRDVPGNHVVLRIDDDVYALYPHLREGSIEVREGQHVTRGQRIARIGNSGNTSSPHLHFHLMDRPDPNLAEGVPFVFTSFELLVDGYTFAPEQRPLPAQGRRLTASAPRKGWVVRFPAAH